jgi:hypothetical protein
VALVGLMLVLAGYYWAHKPVDVTKPGDLEFVNVFGGAFVDVLAAVLIAAAAGGLGRRVVGIIARGEFKTSPPDLLSNALERGREALHEASFSGRSGKETVAEKNDSASGVHLSLAERVALEGGIGLGLLSILALALGLVGLFSGGVFWMMLLVIGIVCLREMFGWLGEVRQLVRRTLSPETGWIRFLTIVVVLLLVLALFHALAPPYAFDSINYHLVGPQRYLAAGRITTQPDNHFLGFPQGVELLYGVAMGLFGRDTAPALIHWWFGVLGLLAVGGLVRRYADAATGWLAITLLMSAFSVWALFGWPYVDLGVMAYGALTLICAVMWRESIFNPAQGEANISGRAGIRWLILMGVCGGLALGVKYTAVGLALASGVFVLVHAPKQMIRNGLIVGAAALVVFAPWLVKGLVLYHNPVYPFIFGGVNWDAGRANTFSTTGTGLLNSASAWQLVILPIAATVFGVEKGDGFSFTAGPWLLTAPLLLLLGWRWLDERTRRLAKDSLLLGLPMLGFWLVMAALSAIGIQTRLMMMALPCAAVVGSLGFYSLQRWPRKPLDIGFIAQALLTLTLVVGVVDVLRDVGRTGPITYLLAGESRSDYLDNNLGIYSNAMRQLATLPQGSRVRLMYEPRAYYCPATVTCIPDILFDHWFRPLRQGKTPDEIFADWKAAGENYLLLYDTGYEFNAKDSRFLSENALFPDALNKWMQPIWTDKLGYTLYGWK